MQRYGVFSGVLDNIVIAGQKYNVWNGISYYGSRYYAETRYGFRPTIDGTWISLFGNGILRHRVGSFQVNADHSELQLEFRTLKDNVVIFGITDRSASFIYGLYISAGRLMFQFATGLGNNEAIITTR